MAAVVFDPAAFKAAYHEFSAVPDATLNGYFVRSQLFLANQDCPVPDEDKRLLLFWLLVAHIAQLAGADGTLLAADLDPQNFRISIRAVALPDSTSSSTAI